MASKDVGKIMNIEERFDFLTTRLFRLEDFVQNEFMIPKMRILIMEIMNHKNNLTHAELWKEVEDHLVENPHNRDYNEFFRIAYWRTFEKLEKEKVLIPTSLGKGHPRTWKYLTWEEWERNKDES